MSELSNIYERLGRIEAEMAGVKATVGSYRELFATESWVREELHSMRDSLTLLAATVNKLSESNSDLYAAHEKFLTDEAARKEEAHRAAILALQQQTFSSVASNWARVAGWVSAIVAAITVAGPPIAAFLQAVLHGK